MSNENKAVLQKALSGDLDAFRDIVQTHQQFVYQAAFHLLANKEDARDATQECFVRVWKNLHAFDTTKKFTTWLYKIIVNLCYDDLRRAYKRRKVAFDGKEFSIAGDSDVEKETINSDLAQKIRLISKGLKPRQRIIFALRDLQELELQEIAGILNISVGAVKSNLFYARKNIRKKMHEMGYIS